MNYLVKLYDKDNIKIDENIFKDFQKALIWSVQEGEYKIIISTGEKNNIEYKFKGGKICIKKHWF